jgi:ubiquinone/menaquinone biosynthesis C-methylase UbiE
MKDQIKKAIEANIIVHSTMADEYNQKEPHFRLESIERVEKIIDKIYSELNFEYALDLGCGTGFMINILKKRAKKIVGVDVTQAMLDKVDLTGQAEITLINSDTGIVGLPQNYFDIATAYTFLDHLYDMRPTFKNTYNSLKSGGVFYADLSPNFYFWQSIKSLDSSKCFDSILQREINAVLKKDEEIEKEFGINKEVFSIAEHQKHKLGGLNEISLKEDLIECGFSKVEFIYHWFVGQAELINNTNIDLNERKNTAEHMHNFLTRSMPLSRHLFKYIGFIAIK